MSHYYGYRSDNELNIKKLQYFVRVVIKYTICGRIPRKALILLDFGIKKGLILCQINSIIHMQY